ncbi:MAG: glycosyltransferase [Vicinamibacterales bacterium]
MNAPLVSVVIVTRNGGGTLPATLDMIARQRVDFDFEVVAVDSGSTDGSLALLERSAQQLVAIPPGSFNHGLTRNLGIQHARGDLIVLLVQDALPSSENWLAGLTAPLRANTDVAGAFCRQQPRPDATALTRLYMDTWIAFSGTSRSVRLTSREEFDRLSPHDRLERCAFDNVCSCIRRSVWQQIPFSDTPIAEDLEWARAALLAGHRLDFVAEAVVVHSHERPAWYEFARTYLLHRRLFELFGLRTIPTAADLVRSIAGSLRLHIAHTRRDPREGGASRGIGRAVALAVAWPAGQYLGGLSAAKRWRPLRVKAV